MATIGQTKTAPIKTPPRPPAGKPQAVAPPGGRGEKKSFAAARPRGANGLFLKGQPDGTAGKYTLKVNKVAQNWANPKAVEDDRPQPTEEELASAKPSFKKQDNYIIEVEVVESNVEACPAGFMASIIFTDKFPDSYFDDIKGFLCACTNAPPEEIDLDDWQASYQPDQPLAGTLFDCMVLEKPTQKGGVFTKHICNVSAQQFPDAGE